MFQNYSMKIGQNGVKAPMDGFSGIILPLRHFELNLNHSHALCPMFFDIKVKAFL